MKLINQASTSSLVVSILLSLMIVLTGCVSPDQENRRYGHALIEKAAPDFTLRDLKGNQVSLSDFRGQPVVLNFWATWCSPCRVEIPHLEALYTKYKDQGLVVLGMNTETDYMKVKQFAEPGSHTPCFWRGAPKFRDMMSAVSHAHTISTGKELFSTAASALVPVTKCRLRKR